ncbi:hypothetical protein IU404_00907 [Limosilactobacillus reuteri]|nr:hypothetical protein IU404_00907 [Limosilactobacillus reuteri]UFK68270.1 hypothetical protein IVR12_01314 [Limosilactobacillus reuteri]
MTHLNDTMSTSLLTTHKKNGICQVFIGSL